jgi:hypothetical protein
VSFRIDLDPGDPGRPDVRLGRAAGAEAGYERRIIREGVEVIAHGALICPSCDLPLVAATAIPAGAPVECGFCGHTARSREFLARDVYDTLGNEAQLVARIV